MIIYGWKSSQVATEDLAESCPHCSSRNSLRLFVFQKYAHIFWIPFFPIGKYGATQCGHCKQVMRSKQMTPDVRLAYDNVATRTKVPYWTVVGLGSVGVFILFAILRKS